MEVVMSMHDFHVPYQDDKAISVALKLAKHLRPKILILHEAMDFYTLSKYNKDPKRIISLQKDLDLTYKLLKRIRDTLPKSRIIMLESNHDRRLMKYKFSKSPELAYLRNLSFESLMSLGELDIEYKDSYIYKNVLFKHGSIVRKDSSYTAKAELLREGMSGASGHCFSADTEILTREGWKRYKELDLDNDMVGTRNKKSGAFEWNRINDLYEYSNYDKLYSIQGQTVDLLVTDKHGILYSN